MWALPCQSIDTRLHRVLAGLTALLSFAAFAFAAVWLVMACVFLLGAVLVGDPIPGVHRRLAQVSNWLGKRSVGENLAPVRFAVGCQIAILAIGLAAMWTDISGVGWLLILLAASLAAVHAMTGICLSCEAYTRMRRSTN